MSQLTHALSSALLHFVWQGTLVALLLSIVLFLLRRRSAQSRYAASCAALAILALLPAATTWMLYRAPSVADSSRAIAAAVSRAFSVPAQPPDLPTAWLPALRAWVLPLWSAGVLLFSLRLAWGCRQISRMRRRGSAPGDKLSVVIPALASRLDISRAVRVLIAEQGDSPSVIGWLRPVILVPPAALLGLTASQLEFILAHELAHIRRHDYLVNLAQTLVEAVLFYHPAVWWISTRIRHERELCCDDLAVQYCGDAAGYARALTNLERLRVSAPAMAMAASGGDMLYRIQRLVGNAAHSSPPSKLPATLALVLGLACFALNIHWAHSQQSQPRGYAFQSSIESTPGVTVDLGGAALANHDGRIEYPGFALERGIEGTLAAELTLNAEGAVTDARIVSGPTELRRSVLQGVLNWRFDRSYANAVLQVRIRFDRAAAASALAALPPAPVRALEGRSARAGDEQARAQLAAAEKEAELQAQRQAEQDQAFAQQRDEGARQASLEVQAKMLEFEAARLNANEQQNADERAAAAEHARAEMAQRQLELKDMQLQLRATREPLARESQSLAGRQLRAIHIFGRVPEGILGHLGIQIGDTLTNESMQSVTAAMQQFDPSLEVRFLPSERNQAELRISAPRVAK